MQTPNSNKLEFNSEPPGYEVTQLTIFFQKQLIKTLINAARRIQTQSFHHTKYWVWYTFQQLFVGALTANVPPRKVKLKGHSSLRKIKEHSNDTDCVLSKQTNTGRISIKRDTITLLVYIAQ